MIEVPNTKKTICWITDDNFVDCDMGIVLSLSKIYKIHWYIIYPYTNSRFNPEELLKYHDGKELYIYNILSKFRLRNPGNITFFSNILNKIRKHNPDIVYINFIGLPYFALVAAILLKKSNTIFAAHQAEVHEGMDHKLILRFYFRFWYSWFTFFNLFSTTQGDTFQKLHPRKKVFIIPLALKEFGKSSKQRLNDKIIFFNFGTIRENKNIGCLIDAACNLFEKGVEGFHVVIKGECKNWEQYSKRIRFPEIFSCDIRLIDNKDIADMFSEYHYLVLPYSSVSQSGILKIAYYYNVPVIASDLEGFKLEIDNGVNGYLFKNKDVEDLENVLRKVLDTHNFKYDSLRKAQKDYTQETLSLPTILEQYRKMFDSILPKDY